MNWLGIVLMLFVVGPIALLAGGIGPCAAAKPTSELSGSNATKPPVARALQRDKRAQLSRDFFVGAWETVNIEFDKSVRIIWTLWEDGRLLYHFDTPGGLVRGSTGHWRVEGDVLFELWERADGSSGAGRGTVERIDDNTIRLTIIDNGNPEYKGIQRVYRRLGPPLLSWMSEPAR